MGSTPHNPKYKWSVTEGVDLMYDAENPNCMKKIKVEWLFK